MLGPDVQYGEVRIARGEGQCRLRQFRCARVRPGSRHFEKGKPDLGKSTILDGNAFDPGSSAGVSGADTALIRRRMRVLGPSYRLFYDRPVHLVRSQGTKVYDVEGREYLDAYNNVASVGHCNPRVVRAVAEQMRTLSTHSRYLQDGIVEYSEQLLATFPGELSQVMFTNSGSESNDLALRVAARATGGTGVVVTSEAYHGTTSIVADVSPAMGRDHRLGDHVATVPAPDSYRRGGGAPLGVWFATQVTAAFDSLRARGVRPSAFLVDTIMASDGVLSDPSVLGPALRSVHQAGAVMIADEVQPGFARTGSAFWGFARHGIVPDLVTLGKPMGNGVPVAAMVARPEVLEPFATEVPYFNTFGGSSVPIAAAQAVLDEIRQKELHLNSESLGESIRSDLRALMRKHEAVGDVRGAGLFVGVEIVADRRTRAPDPELAHRIINTMRDLGVLISVAGPHNSALKIRPMLTYSGEDAARLVATLDEALTMCARQALIT